MRIMKSQLRKIIKEEIKRALFEDDVDAYDAKWEAGDIITMDFSDKLDPDVDDIIDYVLRGAVEALKIIDPSPCRAPLRKFRHGTILRMSTSMAAG